MQRGTVSLPGLGALIFGSFALGERSRQITAALDLQFCSFCYTLISKITWQISYRTFSRLLESFCPWLLSLFLDYGWADTSSHKFQLIPQVLNEDEDTAARARLEALTKGYDADHKEKDGNFLGLARALVTGQVPGRLKRELSTCRPDGCEHLLADERYVALSMQLAIVMGMPATNSLAFAFEGHLTGLTYVLDNTSLEAMGPKRRLEVAHYHMFSLNEVVERWDKVSHLPFTAHLAGVLASAVRGLDRHLGPYLRERGEKMHDKNFTLLTKIFMYVTISCDLRSEI